MDWETKLACFINYCAGGAKDETLCSRIWRNSLLHGGVWKLAHHVCDLLYRPRESSHCWRSHRRYIVRKVKRGRHK